MFAVVLPPAAVSSAAPSQSAVASLQLSDGAVAYANEGDIWVYDVSSGRTQRLTSHPLRSPFADSQPRFLDPDQIVFARRNVGTGSASVMRASISSGGSPIKVVDLPHDESSLPGLPLDVSPDGRLLAFLDDAGESSLIYTLHVFDLASTHEVARRDLGSIFASDFFCGDYVEGGLPREPRNDVVRWSPDGESILVVEDLEGRIYVSRSDGRDVTPSFHGNGPAEWSVDGRTVFFHVWNKEVSELHALDVSNGSSRTLGAPHAKEGLAVSPDGARLAYDDGEAASSLWVYELADGSERRIGPNLAFPLWLTPTSALATSIRAKPIRCEDGGSPVTVSSSRDAIGSKMVDIKTGATTTSILRSTADADVLHKRAARSGPVGLIALGVATMVALGVMVWRGTRRQVVQKVPTDAA